MSEPVLAYGRGRSYGDVCLNDGGILLDTRSLSRFISFDAERGVLHCEAGVTLGEILELAVPRGWFLPVLPGTQFVSIAGAVANDIHGKNHHRAGCFGRFVRSLKLVRSSGERLLCSPQQNAGLFAATIGGLGLTGLILSVEIQLKRVSGPYLEVERIRFEDLDEFFQLTAESDRDYEYTVAWVDSLARRQRLGRGVFIRGNHADRPPSPHPPPPSHRRLGIPFDFPSFVLSRVAVQAFNTLYYWAHAGGHRPRLCRYEPFFFPLDTVREWNRVYGKRGFLQHQAVVSQQEALRELLREAARSGQGSFLTVLKRFGNPPSPGVLSFPRPGFTLTLDFPYQGEATLQLMDRLDQIVLEAGGAVYPAKDARMSPGSFRRFFPRAEEFEQYVDPRFSSSFWRRVTGGGRSSSWKNHES